MSCVETPVVSVDLCAATMTFSAGEVAEVRVQLLHLLGDRLSNRQSRDNKNAAESDSNV